MSASMETYQPFYKVYKVLGTCQLSAYSTVNGAKLQKCSLTPLLRNTKPLQLPSYVGMIVAAVFLLLVNAYTPSQ